MQLKLSTVHNVFLTEKGKIAPQTSVKYNISRFFSFSLNDEENEDNSNLKICKKNTEA